MLDFRIGSCLSGAADWNIVQKSVVLAFHSSLSRVARLTAVLKSKHCWRCRLKVASPASRFGEKATVLMARCFIVRQATTAP